MVKDNQRRYNQAEAVPTHMVMQHPTLPNLFYPVRRSSLRRPDVDYSAFGCICFVTFNVHNACGVLLTEDYASIAWAVIRQELQQTGCTVYAGCLMPDHVHLLMAPSGTGETISDIVRRVKSCICLALRKEMQCYLKWQPSFYDHILCETERQQDEFDAVIAYIRANPQKAGLGDTYPYIL